MNLSKEEYEKAVQTVEALLEDILYCMEVSPIKIMSDLHMIGRHIDRMTDTDSNLHFEILDLESGE